MDTEKHGLKAKGSVDTSTMNSPRPGAAVKTANPNEIRPGRDGVGENDIRRWEGEGGAMKARFNFRGGLRNKQRQARDLFERFTTSVQAFVRGGLAAVRAKAQKADRPKAKAKTKTAVVALSSAKIRKNKRQRHKPAPMH